MGVAFPVVLPVFRAEDYEFFFSRWLAQSAPVAADFDYEEVFKAFPSLTPAEIRVACVPAAAGPPGAEWTTAAVLANVEERLGGAHGAVQLSKVEKIDLARMPGLDKAMEILEEQVVHPFESTAADGAEPKAGVLLYGPPGTGKTSIGRALAHRMPGRLFTVKEMFLYKELVETFAKAEACAPSVIFFDDIDVLLHRSKVAWGGGGIFRFLLSKMDGMSSYRAANGKSVTIIMTCESPKTLPDALIRSGRIELWVKLEYPGNRKRLAILEKLCAEERLEAMRGITAKELKYVADRTEDFSPADLRRVVKDTTNALAYRKAKGKKDKKAGDLLETSVENLRRMRDEVESFMKQLYQ